SFAPPQYVDQNLAGGEPVLFTDLTHHTIVYTSHEGTTHLYRPGLASSTTFTFAGGYRNQVNIWISHDDGKTFQRDDFGGGFSTNPATNTGFSDPDLTQDDGGRIYNTGINLANDSVFSSNDGGTTWDRGTAQCHDGDRPWLAGGRKDEVFMATNTTEGALSHQIFQSTDGGQTCSATGIPDAGSTAGGGSYTGNGKIYREPSSDRLVEPVNFMNANGTTTGLGVGTWKRGDAAFTPHKAVDTSVYAHWSAIALDGAGGLYLVYDDDPRQANTTGGCDGAATPAPNHIRLVHSTDFGQTWSAPLTLDAPPNARVLWPWIAAGDKGRVSVVWYRTDKLVDLACQSAQLSVLESTITGADTANPQVQTVDAVGRPIADNNICQSGTTCVATGEDRRLGDFFTNAIDERGCVIIGTGDSTSKDPLTGGERNVALPLFVRQASGPALRGAGDCASTSSSVIGGSTGKSRRCVSRRHFAIHLRRLKGDRIKRATIYVNHKRVKRVRGKKTSLPVDLRGLPKGRFTITVTATTAKGRHLRDVRRYRTCTPRPKKKK
ncbi:MAG: hypothetical protein QOE28_2581, partial [Solirubrobacteraceae bacterium]|nr:hypothetical protein [Solirubrobacteraceae bacterium]